MKTIFGHGGSYEKYPCSTSTWRHRSARKIDCSEIAKRQINHPACVRER